MTTRSEAENKLLSQKRYYNEQAHFLEDFVDHMLFLGPDNEDIRNAAHALRRQIEEWVKNDLPVKQLDPEPYDWDGYHRHNYEWAHDSVHGYPTFSPRREYVQSRDAYPRHVKPPEDDPHRAPQLVGVSVVGAKLPEGLCGKLSRNLEHCVFTPHPEGTDHSWQVHQ